MSGAERAPMTAPEEASIRARASIVWADAQGIPEAIERTLARTDELDSMAAFLEDSGVRRIVAAGNGASYYAALALSLTSWASGAGPEVLAVPAGLLVPGRFRWRTGDILLSFSSSGELNDLIEAPRLLGTGPYAAITSNPDSSLGRRAAVTVEVAANGQRSMTHTRSYCGAIVSALSVWARLTGDRDLHRALQLTPPAADAALASAWDWIDSLRLTTVPASAVVLGSGVAWAAALEAALLFKELAGIPSEGVESREGATSAMFGLSRASLAVSLETHEDPHLAQSEASCAAMGASVARVTSAGGSDQRLAPVASFPLVLALALQLSVMRGRDPDAPDWASAYLSTVRGGSPTILAAEDAS